jgi:predicted cupin superfamily sugar epimerase
MNDAASIISRLEMLPHPEGGWYREVYRSDDVIQVDALPDRYKTPHSFSTSIYFLLESHNFSAFHRISSDETWHFYLGSPVVIYIISNEGEVAQIIVGNNLYNSPRFLVCRQSCG